MVEYFPSMCLVKPQATEKQQQQINNKKNNLDDLISKLTFTATFWYIWYLTCVMYYISL